MGHCRAACSAAGKGEGTGSPAAMDARHRGGGVLAEGGARRRRGSCKAPRPLALPHAAAAGPVTRLCWPRRAPPRHGRRALAAVRVLAVLRPHARGATCPLGWPRCPPPVGRNEEGRGSPPLHHARHGPAAWGGAEGATPAGSGGMAKVRAAARPAAAGGEATLRAGRRAAVRPAAAVGATPRRRIWPPPPADPAQVGSTGQGGRRQGRRMAARGCAVGAA